jgi:hypothetical protein
MKEKTAIEKLEMRQRRINRLKKEINELSDENDTFGDENIKLRNENIKLKNENEKLTLFKEECEETCEGYPVLKDMTDRMFVLADSIDSLIKEREKIISFEKGSHDYYKKNKSLPEFYINYILGERLRMDGDKVIIKNDEWGRVDRDRIVMHTTDDIEDIVKNHEIIYRFKSFFHPLDVSIITRKGECKYTLYKNYVPEQRGKYPGVEQINEEIKYQNGLSYGRDLIEITLEEPQYIHGRCDLYHSGWKFLGTKEIISEILEKAHNVVIN